MAECLTYASGRPVPHCDDEREPGARAPWFIYGDQRDSLSLLAGWIRCTPRAVREALDLALMAYAVAEDPRVSLPVSERGRLRAHPHTYESVEVPTADE